MNFKMVKYVLGWVALFNGAFLLVPLFTALIYSEQTAISFLITLGICVALGCLGVFTLKPTRKELFAKEGFVITALCWLVISLLGALPFVFSGVTPSFFDAIFESVSGFTTTGATIFSSVEQLPKSILIWRSFSHWIGGMGVLVFVMAIMPLSGANNINMMKAESTGPKVGKIVPRVKNTALILYGIYIALTVLQFLLLVFGDMTVFEAINTALATAGTGGFGVRNDGLASYTAYSQIVVTVFMLLFSINFNAFFLIACFKIKEAFSVEVKTFFVIVLVAIVSITINVLPLFDTVGEAIRHSAFSVSSVISTTGFATTDFSLWPALSQMLLVLLSFVGACAGSTGGGIKVSRIIILFKQAGRELSRLVHPKQVRKIMLDGKPLEKEVIRGVNAYFVCYTLIFVFTMLIISFDGHDFTTNFTATTAVINNVGPGLGKVGPMFNYGFFSSLSKVVMSLTMIAGRLEIFPLLLLVTPSTWKK